MLVILLSTHQPGELSGAYMRPTHTHMCVRFGGGVIYSIITMVYELLI